MLLAQHQWLEATDTKHRYGAYLFEYYHEWAESQTEYSFFHWLDNGQGKDFGFTAADYEKDKNKVVRTDLDDACVNYCNEEERRRFEVKVVDGKMCGDRSPSPVHSARRAPTAEPLAPPPAPATAPA